MIDLYTSPTPNGWKAAMMLEEVGADYTVKYIDLAAGDQHKPAFLAMNPNGRIPVIVDHDVDGQTVFDSNAILFYLAEKSGKLLPASGPARHDVMQWLMFQASGIGPMQGQAVTFERYFPEDVPAARTRYHNETRRLYSVLDTRLADRTWRAGDFSIADISNCPGSAATAGHAFRPKDCLILNAGWTSCVPGLPVSGGLISRLRQGVQMRLNRSAAR